MPRPGCSVVVLSQGDRAVELARAIGSVRAQRDVEAEVIIVWNGSRGAADGWRPDQELRLGHNVGIPAARNRGAELASHPYLLFLDDDAELGEATVLCRAAAQLTDDTTLGIVALRIVDESGSSAQRHVPRVGGLGPGRSGSVTAFLGGAVMMRTTMFRELGGYEPELFYAMEETDLAWRAIDRGFGVWYAADLVVRHPRSDPTRHPAGAWQTARNRAWIAHRLLPVPLAIVYSVAWLAIGLGRGVRRPHTVLPTIRGMAAGWRHRLGPRAPIRWRTVLRLTTLGRPPVI